MRGIGRRAVDICAGAVCLRRRPASCCAPGQPHVRVLADVTR
jgi:hypothetical protein